MPQRIEIADEKRRQAYVYYTSVPAMTVPQIAAYLGVGRSTFVRLRQRWAWPPRLVALDRNDVSMAAEDPADPAAGHAAASASLRDAARALARATRAQINALVEKQRGGCVDDHDATARTLASYAKTLTTARALLEQEGSPLDGHEPQDERSRSLHELRDELARRLEQVIAEEEACGRDGLLL